jgi:ABC-2 type transport system permease protein
MSLRPYRAVVGARFRTLLQYRAAAVAGVWTQIMFGLVLIMIYEAFYRSSPAPPPITLPRLASYVWLGQALFAMVPWNADLDIRALIRSGGIAYELARPLDLYTLWFGRAVALRTAPTLLRALPAALFAMFVLPLVGLEEWRLAPPAPLAGLAFAATLCGSLLLGCAITTLINISLLWTISGEGVVMVAATAVMLLSGMLVPLPLFPDWAQGALAWLPFAPVIDQPFRLYTGDLPAGDAVLVLARQALWTAIVVGLGRRVLARGLRRVVVQGG